MPRLHFRIRTLVIITALAALGLRETLAPGRSDVRATSSEPSIAVRQEKRFAGVLWGLSYEQARAQAEWEGRPILIYFSSISDANGRLMEHSAFTRPDIRLLLSHFVTVRLEVDCVPIGSINADQRALLAETNLALQVDLTRDTIVPSFVALSERAGFVAYSAGCQEPEAFSAFLRRALARWERGRRQRLPSDP